MQKEITGREIALEIRENKIHLFSQKELNDGDFLNLLGFTDVNKETEEKTVHPIEQTVTENVEVRTSDDEDDDDFFNIIDIFEDEPEIKIPEEIEKEELPNDFIYISKNHYTARYSALNCFVLRYALKGYKFIASPEDKNSLKVQADTINLPTATLNEEGTHIHTSIPGLPVYRDILTKLGAFPSGNGFRVLSNKVFEFETMIDKTETNLPKILIDESVKQLTREPIIGYDGTVDSLKDIPVSILNIIQANSQNVKSKSASKKTLSEKFVDFGIENLYDLLFFLPKRYIDKTNPVGLDGLIDGENAVVMGEITNVKTAGSGRTEAAVFFVQADGDTRPIRTTYFSQSWLRNKFRKGDHVVINGKYSPWKGSPQITGVTIEHSDEVEILPVVPVYSQSPSKGLTTQTILSAMRELISRMGRIKLPVYFRQEGRMDYFEALTELHFPSEIERHLEALEDLAYYELVYMQLVIQDSRNNASNNQGIAITEAPRKLQAKSIKSLPFELTKSQKFAIVEMNKKIAKETPTSTLLNADVGAGKTAVAISACLRAVDGGYQAVLLAPTDVLAQQLYTSLQKTVTSLLNDYQDDVNIGLLSVGMKAKERKEILSEIKDGIIDIVVGTHSVMSQSVEYANLGFIAIDEQQKFGAEQRTRLLNSRSDGKIPHLLMQTATAIPRTTAQVIYGEIDLIELKEKPAGRIPIVTEWIEEDPSEIVEQVTNSIWADLLSEIEKGNQAFIVTPLVRESDKIDAASAEKTYKNISELSMSSARIGIVHGQMKTAEQQEVMKKFKNKEYDVLVASTIIEVGIDIQDATRIVVLSAERLGSASLHQIRGRVGRNDKPSKCYLVSLGKTDDAQLRMKSLVENADGFAVAQRDLEIRGEGKMFSSEQSGNSDMIFANLMKHSSRIEEAKNEAIRILKSPFKEKALLDASEKFNSDNRMM